MMHQVLLITHDPQLAARLRRALPLGIATELTALPHYEVCPDGRGWLTMLVDAPAAAAGSATLPPGETAPVVWLGAPPLITEIGEWSAAPGQIVDYVSRAEAPSKWAMILHQHLSAAYLRRVRIRGAARAPSVRPAAPDELQRQINNALTGILGNAGLALDAGRRLPAPLSQRLQRIVELATQMREALGVLLPAATTPPPPRKAA